MLILSSFVRSFDLNLLFWNCLNSFVGMLILSSFVRRFDFNLFVCMFLLSFHFDWSRFWICSCLRFAHSFEQPNSTWIFSSLVNGFQPNICLRKPQHLLTIESLTAFAFVSMLGCGGFISNNFSCSSSRWDFHWVHFYFGCWDIGKIENCYNFTCLSWRILSNIWSFFHLQQIK